MNCSQWGSSGGICKAEGIPSRPPACFCYVSLSALQTTKWPFLIRWRAPCRQYLKNNDVCKNVCFFVFLPDCRCPWHWDFLFWLQASCPSQSGTPSPTKSSLSEKEICSLWTARLSALTGGCISALRPESACLVWALRWWWWGSLSGSSPGPTWKEVCSASREKGNKERIWGQSWKG